MAEQQATGTKRVRAHGAKAKPKTPPNKKAQARAEARTKSYEILIKSLSKDRNEAGYHKPGSTNRRNQQ
jgi:hypothetical protein